MVPAQKLRLVRALQNHGDVVAMTGDGVNDAPALKAAHIGIAMGLRGTDVARESASLVLLDDDFASIVRAVRLGRRIFDNLRKAAGFVIAVHVPIAGIALLPVLLGWPLVLLPVHIVFIELIIDPICSVAFEAEPEEADVMRRPPRRSEEGLFTWKSLLVSFLQGAGVLAVVFATLLLSRSRGLPDGETRALAFATLVLGSLGLVLTNRSWSGTFVSALRRPNPILGVMAGSAFAVLAATLYVPFLARLFRFEPLGPTDLAMAISGAVVSLLWCESLKSFRR
jgi:Ca2+-transporting ATPase